MLEWCVIPMSLVWERKYRHPSETYAVCYKGQRLTLSESCGDRHACGPWTSACRHKRRCLYLSSWSCWRGRDLQKERPGAHISSFERKLWTRPGEPADPALLNSPKGGKKLGEWFHYLSACTVFGTYVTLPDGVHGEQIVAVTHLELHEVSSSLDLSPLPLPLAARKVGYVHARPTQARREQRLLGRAFGPVGAG